MKPKRLARRAVYESRWACLYLDRVEFPTGKIIDDYHLVHIPNGAVGAVVVNDRDEILFVRAYRYPTDSIEWEIPTGGMNDCESVVDAARREVLEETGYDTIDHRLIYDYYPTNGNSDQHFYVLGCKATTTTGEFDRSEIESVHWFTKDEALQMIGRREISDGFTLSALLLYFAGIS